jgi:hypothetical protein
LKVLLSNSFSRKIYIKVYLSLYLVWVPVACSFATVFGSSQCVRSYFLFGCPYSLATGLVSACTSLAAPGVWLTQFIQFLSLSIEHASFGALGVGLTPSLAAMYSPVERGKGSRGQPLPKIRKGPTSSFSRPTSLGWLGAAGAGFQ